MVAQGEFRQDLFYRINTVHLQLPALRDRREDIPAFVDLFLDKYARIYGKPKPQISDEAVCRLQSRQWPGNIRQLEHVIEKALILNDGEKLMGKNFDLYDDIAVALPSGTLEDMERQAIAAAIKQCSGNIADVARQLGITRQTLYNKIKKYGL